MNLVWVSIKSEEWEEYDHLLDGEFDVVFHNYSERPFSSEEVTHIWANMGLIVEAPGEEKLAVAARVIPDYRYDQYAFLDGDLDLPPDALDRLFSVGNDLRLPLYQPALTPRSLASHAFLKQQSDSAVRKVPFVEIMAPFFSADALRACLPTFDINLSGWGLDVYLWPHKVAGECFVIDRIPIGHYNEPSRRDRVQANGKTPTQECQEIADKCIALHS